MFNWSIMLFGLISILLSRKEVKILLKNNNGDSSPKKIQGGSRMKNSTGVIIIVILLLILGGQYFPSIYKHFANGKKVTNTEISKKHHAKHEEIKKEKKVVVKIEAVNTPVPVAASIKRGVLYTNKTGKDLGIWANINGNKNNQLFMGTLGVGQDTFIPAGKGYLLSTTFKGFFFEATRTQGFVEIGKEEVYRQDI